MKIQESAENYLETILILKNKNGAVRSIDIANELGFSKPSVSVAILRLTRQAISHCLIPAGRLPKKYTKGTLPFQNGL